MDNKEILAEIKNNNQHVVEMVYKKYRNKFIAFAYKKYGLDKELGKGIYQDAFLAFFNNVQNGRLSELTVQVQTYLFQIGRNHILNHFKRAQRYHNVEPGSYEEELMGKGESSEDIELEEKKRMLVLKHLEQISERCRELLKLFYFEKKDYDEIVEAMDFNNIDSAKTQKYKCMKKLEQTLTEEYNQIVNYD